MLGGQFLSLTGLLRSNSTADDEVIGIVHDVRLPTLFVSEFLPPQHEPSHVQIAEQRTVRRPLWTRSRLATLSIESSDSFVNKGFDFFKQAVQKDPSYAPAYVGLAESHINLMFAYNVVSPAEGCENAESESQKALEIDDANAEAHARLARFKLQCAWDWAGAEKEFRQALELEPGSSEVHHQYAHFLVAMGRTGPAWGESLRTLELDPYGIRANSHQGWHHFYAREYDLAIRDFQRALTMEPNDSYSRRYLANSYEKKGMYPEAVAELQKTPPGAAWTPVMRAALGYADAMAGNRREAMTIASELETESKQQFVPALDIGLIYLSLDDKDRALEWLERAYRERSSLLIYLKVDPRFDALRSAPRFRDLVQRVGLNM